MMKLTNMASVKRSGVGSPSKKVARVSCVKVSASAIVAKDTIPLGRSGLIVSSLGIGAWSWGDRSGYWGYQDTYEKEDNQKCYEAVLRGGINFIDTAEVYGYGLSEELLGQFVRQGESNGYTRPFICTKFAPLPWRLTRGAVPEACKASLSRLGMPQMDLYLQHWPGFFFNAFSNDEYLEGLAESCRQGLTKSVGVSNFNKDRLRAAARKMEKEGFPLATNQVNYSLIYRAPERNGVLEACREAGVTLMAYSPLAQGLLTGKYKPGSAKPSGPRQVVFSNSNIEKIQPLLECMGAIGKERGKTQAQIALNWLMCQPGVFPIPGAKNIRQAEEAAGALGWRLTEGEVAELTKVSTRVGDAFQGAPFENW